MRQLLQVIRKSICNYLEQLPHRVAPASPMPLQFAVKPALFQWGCS